MAIIKVDWSDELQQVKATTQVIVDEQLSPMINTALGRAGRELKGVVNETSDRLQNTIQQLTDEVHNHRKLTSDEIIKLIDYATERIGHAIDARLLIAKEEASDFVIEKVDHMKAELAEVALSSRRTLYKNLAISLASTFCMAFVALGYKKLSNGELDLMTIFRGVFLSASVGSTLLGCLRVWNRWRALSTPGRNLVAVALTHLSVLRPNGALGPFLLALAMLLGWFCVTFFVR